MKLVLATGIFPPDIGGPATYSKLLADKLPARGFSVTIANFGEVVRLPKILRHIAYFFGVLWRGVRADIIYAQDPVSVGLPAMLAAKLLRKKFYLKIVGDYAWEQGQMSNVKCQMSKLEEFQNERFDWVTELRRIIERYVARNAEKIIVPSEYLKKIVMLWGIKEEKITVIYNGFDTPVLSEDKSTLRKKLGISGHAILSIGRLVPWKGFEALIEMMPALVKQIPDSHLFIVGDGPDKKVLEEKISALHLTHHVTLVGKLSQEKLFEYIKASDAFVLNTSYEGFSHQLLEVMALGTPIITTPAGGNIEIIENRKNGLFAPYNDLDLWKKAIIGLYKDKELAEQLAQAAQERVKEFSKERMLENVTRVFLAMQKGGTHGMNPVRGRDGAQRASTSNGMNILSISSDRKLFEEGSAVRARTLEYGKLVNELHVIVFANKKLGLSDTKLGDNIFVYPTNHKYKIFYLWNIFRIVKLLACPERSRRVVRPDAFGRGPDPFGRRDCQLSVVSTQDPFESGLAGYFIARVLGARLHLQIHTDFMSPYFARESFLNRVRVHIAKFLLPRANGIRVVSERIKRSLSQVNCQMSNVSVLPVFIDVKKIQSAEVKTDLHKKYPEYDFIILMASRLSPEKNISLAIKAMAEIKSLSHKVTKSLNDGPLNASMPQLPNVLLLIVGDGPKRAELQKLIVKGQLSNVIIEPWTSDVASYYKTADLFLLTSNYEGYGMTIVEALSAGCPVVMTDVGCAGDVVENGKNGLVVPVGDEKALTAAVLKVLSGEAHLEAKTPFIGDASAFSLKLPTKEEYLTAYKNALTL